MFTNMKTHKIIMESSHMLRVTVLTDGVPPEATKAPKLGV